MSYNHMRTDNEGDWEPQDFVDDSAPISSDSDPWDPLSISLGPSSNTASAPPSGVSPVAPISGVPSSEVEDTRSHPFDTPAFSSESLSTQPDEFDIPRDWFDDSAEEEQEPEALESPIPVLEYDPNLGEDLYGIAEFIDLTEVELRLDLFLAGVGPVP